MNVDAVNEQRAHLRYKAKEGALVIIKRHTNSPALGQIIDISRGGLSFKYLANGKFLKGKNKLDIFISGQGIKLKNISFKTIADITLNENISFSSIRMKRCGVQFEKLSPRNKSQLINFIRIHTVKNN